MVTARHRWRSARTLVAAAHPLPSVAVTTFTTVLGAAAGNGAVTTSTIAVAVLAGQLSIGWSNDRIDAARDRAAGRVDKPVARGALDSAVLDRAIAVAVAVTVTVSLTLGWRAGFVHLGAVACGWLYNVGLKATVLSWLPYAAAFAALPAVATFARPDHAPPTGWALVAAGLLGVAGHLTNALPDLADDRAHGVLGLPQRLGSAATVVVASVLLLAGSAVLVLAPAGFPGPLRWAGLSFAAAWTGAGSVLAARAPTSRWVFRGTLAVVALDLALLLLGPSFTR